MLLTALAMTVSIESCFRLLDVSEDCGVAASLDLEVLRFASMSFDVLVQCHDRGL